MADVPSNVAQIYFEDMIKTYYATYVKLSQE